MTATLHPSIQPPALVVPPLRCSACCRSIAARSEGWEDGKGGLLCQDCWETQTGKSFTSYMRQMEPTGYPDEYRRVTPATTKIGQDHGEGEG